MRARTAEYLVSFREALAPEHAGVKTIYQRIDLKTGCRVYVGPYASHRIIFYTKEKSEQKQNCQMKSFFKRTVIYDDIKVMRNTVASSIESATRKTGKRAKRTQRKRPQSVQHR